MPVPSILSLYDSHTSEIQRLIELMDDSTFDFGTLIEKSITMLGRGAKILVLGYAKTWKPCMCHLGNETSWVPPPCHSFSVTRTCLYRILKLT